MKYRISKKIVKKAIQEEINTTGIPVAIFPLTKTENIIHIITNEIENKKNDNSINMLTLLRNIKQNLIESQNQVGDYDYIKDYIKILLSEIESISPTKMLYLWELLTTTYHEYNHKIFWSNDQKEKNLENFTIILENLTYEMTDIYDKNHHDDFKEEIIANVYSVEKASQFLKRYPHIYEELKGYIENDRMKYQIQFINYDVEQFLNYMTKIIKKKANKQELFQSIYPYKIVEILYNKDGTFKNLLTLSKDIEWTSLDKEVQHTVVASKAYQNELDYTNLSLDELIFIQESLTAIYAKEMERQKQNNILREQIDSFNKTVLPSLEYGENNLPLISKKEHRNRLKIKYLDHQIKIVENLLQELQNSKKK